LGGKAHRDVASSRDIMSPVLCTLANRANPGGTVMSRDARVLTSVQLAQAG